MVVTWGYTYVKADEAVHLRFLHLLHIRYIFVKNPKGLGCVCVKGKGGWIKLVAMGMVSHGLVNWRDVEELQPNLNCTKWVSLNS